MTYQPYQRSEAEWLEVMEHMAGGHVSHYSEPGYTVKGTTYLQSGHMRKFLAPLLPLAPGARVLDIGSGNARAAIALCDLDIYYLGIEPQFDAIKFSRFAMQPWADRFQFECVDLRNGLFNPNGTVAPATWRIPCDDASQDCILVNSVFTHLETYEVAAHYVAEIMRVAKPGAGMLTTWFKSPPNAVSGAAFRTVFPEEVIRNLLRDTGLIAEFGGATTADYDHWCIFSRKRGASA